MQSKFKMEYPVVTYSILQLIFYITIFANIPIARQILGFIHFTFLPGLNVIKLLKLDDKLNGNVMALTVK